MGTKFVMLSSFKFYSFPTTHLSGAFVCIQVLRNFDSIISSNCTEELENSGIEVLKYSQVWLSLRHVYSPYSCVCCESHFMLLVPPECLINANSVSPPVKVSLSRVLPILFFILSSCISQYVSKVKV